MSIFDSGLAFDSQFPFDGSTNSPPSVFGWRFEAVRPGSNIRQFTPQTMGSISFDLSREVPKTINGLTVPPDQWAVIDVRLDQLSCILAVDGADYPMGMFVFSELARQKSVVVDSAGNAGDLITASLSDRCMLLIRNEGRAESLNRGFDPSNEMQRILSNSGVPYSVSAAPNLSVNSITWAGDTTDLAKVKELGTLAGHRPLWMDNNGVIRSVAAQVIDTEIIPLSTLQPIAGSIAIVEKFLTAPNRVIVSDNGAAAYAIRGQWDAPASAPHSRANRGYVMSTVQESQGLGSADHAQNVAATLGEQYTARSLAASIVPTPVLDGPQVISYDGANWLVTGWSVDLSPGSTMSIQAEELIS